MNTLILLFSSLAFLSPAAQQQDQMDHYDQEPSPHSAQYETRALVSIHWNLIEKRLCADVGIGHEEDGAFQIDRLDDQYCVDPAKALMTYRGQTKPFDKETAADEQKMLKSLLKVLSEYMGDSIQWFNQAAGEHRPVAQRK